MAPSADRGLSVFDKAVEDVAVLLGKSTKADPRPVDVVDAFVKVQDRVRERLLEKHYWPFAEDLVQLQKSAETPPFGYQAFYELPPRFISFTYVNDSGVLFEGLRSWDHLRGMLAVNFEPVYASFTQNITDERLMSPSFKDMWIYAIAADICYQVTKDKDLKQDLKAEVEKLAPEAVQISYRSQGRGTIQGREFVEAHSGLDRGFRDDTVLAQLPQTPIFPDGVPTNAN